MPTDKNRTRTSTNLRERIAELAITTRWSAAEINRYIRQDATFRGEDFPGHRTVERLVERTRSPDSKGPPWSMDTFSGRDARLILGVRFALLKELDTPVRKFSHDEAHWIVKIRKTAPDLDPVAAYLIARLYMVRIRSKVDTDDLDSYLAIEPWKDMASYHKYYEWVGAGLFPPVPMFRRLVDSIKPVIDPLEKHVIQQMVDLGEPGDEAFTFVSTFKGEPEELAEGFQVGELTLDGEPVDIGENDQEEKAE